MTLEITQSWTPAPRTLGRVLMGVSRLLGPRRMTVQTSKPPGGAEGSSAQRTLSWVLPHARPAAFGGQGGSGLRAHNVGPAPTEPTGKRGECGAMSGPPSGAVTVLERLDWAPGAGDAKWPLSWDPCTGASMAWAPPEASESGLLPLPAPGPTFPTTSRPSIQVATSASPLPGLQIGWTSCAFSGVRTPSGHRSLHRHVSPQPESPGSCSAPVPSGPGSSVRSKDTLTVVGRRQPTRNSRPPAPRGCGSLRTGVSEDRPRGRSRDS